MNKFTKKAFFFDRDNTLIKDNGYTHLIKDLKFLPGVLNAIKFLKEEKYLIIVITNQSGIARGYFKKKDVITFHLNKKNIIMIGDKLSDKLSAKKTNIKFFYKSRKINLYSQVKKILKNNNFK